MTDLTDDQIERACAWTDYRHDHGHGDPTVLRIQHEAFKAGWDAAHQPAGTDRGALR
jgi:hypothetical protein